MQSPLDILIIDNTAFAHGFNLNLLHSSGVTLFITPEIYEEASQNAKSRQLLEISQNQGILNIQNADQKSYNKVEQTSVESGDSVSLSNADKSLIALALELKQNHPDKSVMLMSDDYAIQNVCSLMQINIYTLHQQGIKKIIKWEVYCPYCFEVFPNEKLGMTCSTCEMKLKRRPKKLIDTS